MLSVSRCFQKVILSHAHECGLFVLFDHISEYLTKVGRNARLLVMAGQ